MINTQAFSARTCESANDKSYTLMKNIAAIQVLPADSGDGPRLGMITQLPSGAELTVCGEGFNERTVRVRWAEGYYFVFLQDLESPKTYAASA